jgi:siderophore synthetase component
MSSEGLVQNVGHLGANIGSNIVYHKLEKNLSLLQVRHYEPDFKQNVPLETALVLADKSNSHNIKLDLQREKKSSSHNQSRE